MNSMTGLRTVELSQGTIHYRDVGEGDPVVFVHGVLANGRLWDGIVPTVADQARCLVPDLPLGAHRTPMVPGADLSPAGVADLLVEFCDALDVERATVVGNDTGGAICQVLLARHPDRLDGVVLTNCDAYDNFLPTILRPLRYGARLPGVVPLVGLAFLTSLVRRLVARVVSKRRPDPETLEAFFGPVASDPGIRRDLRAFLSGISSRYTLEAAEGFPSFDEPILLAWAPEDPLFPLARAERMAASFPNASLETVTDSWAFVPLDRPDWLASRVSTFLAESSTGTGGLD